jgi:hypothetical protein
VSIGLDSYWINAVVLGVRPHKADEKPSFAIGGQHNQAVIIAFDIMILKITRLFATKLAVP